MKLMNKQGERITVGSILTKGTHVYTVVSLDPPSKPGTAGWVNVTDYIGPSSFRVSHFDLTWEEES